MPAAVIFISPIYQFLLVWMDGHWVGHWSGSWMSLNSRWTTFLGRWWIWCFRDVGGWLYQCWYIEQANRRWYKSCQQLFWMILSSWPTLGNDIQISMKLSVVSSDNSACKVKPLIVLDDLAGFINSLWFLEGPLIFKECSVFDSLFSWAASSSHCS